MVPWVLQTAWYKKGFDDLKIVKALDEEIQIFSAPCFLATKFEAYHDRGKDDYFTEDFEDIIYVIDNRNAIVEEITNAPEEIKDYIIEEFKNIWNSPKRDEILSIHLHPLMLEERFPVVIEKISQIVKL